jgi:hypothetical protein
MGKEPRSFWVFPSGRHSIGASGRPAEGRQAVGWTPGSDSHSVMGCPTMGNKDDDDNIAEVMMAYKPEGQEKGG